MSLHDELRVCLDGIGCTVGVRSAQRYHMTSGKSGNDGLSHRATHVRRGDVYAYCTLRKIELPAQPCHCETLFEQKCVSE